MCYKSEFLKCLKTKECGPWIPALLKPKEGATRERKLHPRCKDPTLKKYFVNLLEFFVLFERLQMSFVQYVKGLHTPNDITVGKENHKSVGLAAQVIVPILLQ